MSSSSNAAHHPVMEQYDPPEAMVPEGCSLDLYGMLNAPHMDWDRNSPMIMPLMYDELPKVEDVLKKPVNRSKSTLHEFNEEYFEAVDLMESVHKAQDTYVMFELGAGFGRWGIRAWHYAKRKGIKNPHIVFVEAEPVHYRDLQYHIELNGMPKSDYTLYDAAVSDEEKTLHFTVLQQDLRNARRWYGQALDHELCKPQSGEFTQSNYMGKPMHYDRVWQRGFIDVKALRLSKMMEPFPVIDLLDLDIQGEEAKVMAEAMPEMNKRVKRAHIGTHGNQIEDDLFSLFTKNGWTNLNNYRNQQDQMTPYGMITFLDGVQTWVNPKFA